MSKARQRLVSAIAAVQNCLADPLFLTKSPTDIAHNAMAKIARNGLAVVAFASLEEFIRARTGEICGRINSSNCCGVPFSKLPEGIQKAALHGALAATSFQVALLGKAKIDPTPFVQSQALAIASTAQSAYSMSQFSFGYDENNLNAESVEKVLTAFKVDNTWSALSGISRRIGASGLNLKESFNKAALTRHRAAHQADADVEFSDLESFCKDAIAISASLDIALSTAAHLIVEGNADYLGKKGLMSKDILLRFIEPRERGWRDRKEDSSRSAFTSDELDKVKNHSTNIARSNRTCVIVKDSRALPIDWYTPFLD